MEGGPEELRGLLLHGRRGKGRRGRWRGEGEDGDGWQWKGERGFVVEPLLYPRPLEGLDGVRPSAGWSQIQIPGVCVVHVFVVMLVCLCVTL